MSEMISGLNLGNVSEYSPFNTYSQYDIVDFQMNTGKSIYPTGVNGLKYWFSNKDLSNFYMTPDAYITGWSDYINGSTFLSQTSYSNSPYINFNDYFFSLYGNQNLTGSVPSLVSGSKTLFFIYNLQSQINGVNQQIFQLDLTSTTGACVQIAGAKGNLSEQLYLPDGQRSLYLPTESYGQVNILSVQFNDASKTLTFRQNGLPVGSFTGNQVSNSWNATTLQIGGSGNNVNSNFNFYDALLYTGILSQQNIEGIEKYFFEQFLNPFDGVFISSQSVPTGYLYSPMSFSGASYWTQNFDDLFQLSYGSMANFKVQASKTTLHDGYVSNAITNLNPLTSKFNLIYDGLTDKQTKAAIALFESFSDTSPKSINEGFRETNLNLFFPYQQSNPVYGFSLSHKTNYEDINQISIEVNSIYDSILNYKGLNVDWITPYCRSYSDVDGIESNFNKYEMFYFKSTNFASRGYYIYTGDSQRKYIMPSVNGITGASSLFTKDFIFKPDLSYGNTENPKLIEIGFENSASMYKKDGLKINLLDNLSFTFSNRNNREAYSILKFLDNACGYRTFNFVLPQPYNKKIKVYCPEWQHIYHFYDNHEINVKFVETKNPVDYPSTTFNTLFEDYSRTTDSCEIAGSVAIS